MTHPLWPLYDLRVRTERIELRLPTEDEIAALADVARAGIHGPDEMPFVGPWSVATSPEFEWGFIRYHWRARGTWEQSHWSLELGAFSDGEAIGVQTMFASDFARLRTVHTGSWLGRAYQGHGLGREMRIAILGLAFDGMGAEVAETEAFTDNAASLGVSRSVGYEENGVGRRVPEDHARETLRFRMTRERWRHVRAERAFPDVTIAGLEPSLPLLGAD